MNGYEFAVLLVIASVLVVVDLCTARWAPTDLDGVGVRSVTEYAERKCAETRNTS